VPTSAVTVRYENGIDWRT
jgi:hypothetical protein